MPQTNQEYKSLSTVKAFKFGVSLIVFVNL